MAVAIITGGAGGIGLATTNRLLSAGWRVAVVDASPSDDFRSGNATNLSIIQGDVRDPKVSVDVCNTVVAKWGQINLLVNCAGVNRHNPLEDFALDDWRLVLDVNLTGTFLFMQAAARHMLEAGSGAIVNVSSIAGSRGVPDRCAYAASKAAVESLTRSAAVGWATRGIRVNTVAPGFTETPLVRKFIDSGSINAEDLIKTTPMRRLADPDEIASAIVYLGSKESSFVTGQTFYVDGGFMAEYGIPSSYSQ